MKKLLAAAAAAACVALSSGAAYAQEEFSFILEGRLTSSCEVQPQGIEAVEVVQLNGQEQQIGSINYVCGTGFTRTISSENGFVLERDDDDDGEGIPYTIRSGGAFNLSAASAPGDTELVTVVPGQAQFIEGGVSAPLFVTPGSPPAGVSSGVFSDVVTVAVVATS